MSSIHNTSAMPVLIAAMSNRVRQWTRKPATRGWGRGEEAVVGMRRILDIRPFVRGAADKTCAGKTKCSEPGRASTRTPCRKAAVERARSACADDLQEAAVDRAPQRAPARHTGSGCR